MNIEQALCDFAVQLEADGRSAHTRAQYERHIGMLAAWLASEGHSLEVEHIGHRDLARFLVSDLVKLRGDGRPRKASSANTIRSSLRVFFGYLHTAGYLRRDPARLIRRAVCGPAPPRGLSDDEQHRLLEAFAQARTPAEKRDAVLFRLLLATGARLGSVLRADVQDFSAEDGELRLWYMKFGREGVVPVPEDVVESVAGQIGERREGPIFVGRAGRGLAHRQAARRFRGWLAGVGIERVASPHSLRHSFATRLYEESRDLLLVQAALGHRSVLSTTVYAQSCSLPANRRHSRPASALALLLSGEERDSSGR